MSEVFERKADYFILTTSYEKNYSFIAPRIEKTMKYCENHVFVWKLSHFFVLFASVADRGPSSAVAFSRITSSILKFGTDIFTIIERNEKAIFREYFSSLCFYSGKIFMIIIFSRGPRATYCITSKSTPAFKSREGGQKFKKLRSRRLL